MTFDPGGLVAVRDHSRDPSCEHRRDRVRLCGLEHAELGLQDLAQRPERPAIAIGR